MMLELLLVFVMLSVIIFIFILHYLFNEESPTLEKREPGVHIGHWRMATPLIIVNMIFIILVIYGFYNMEWFYVQGTPSLYGVESSEYQAYAYVFVVFWFIHFLLLFKAGFDSWRDALTVKGRQEWY